MTHEPLKILCSKIKWSRKMGTVDLEGTKKHKNICYSSIGHGSLLAKCLFVNGIRYNLFIISQLRGNDNHVVLNKKYVNLEVNLIDPYFILVRGKVISKKLIYLFFAMDK